MGEEAGRAPSGGLRSCACSRTGWGRHHHHYLNGCCFIFSVTNVAVVISYVSLFEAGFCDKNGDVSLSIYLRNVLSLRFFAAMQKDVFYIIGNDAV